MGLRRNTRSFFLLASVAMLRCGGAPAMTDAGGQGGGGSGVGSGDDGTPPAAPVPPTAPSATPTEPALANFPNLSACPTGWHELQANIVAPDGGRIDVVGLDAGRDALTDFVNCQPYVMDAPDTCTAAQAHFVGTPGCQPVGDPCPLGDV